MEINWFTFFAQIVNFLILLAILQKFLYRPIISAMERREETIRDRLAAAEQKRQETQQEAADYQQKQQQWASKQAERLAQVKAEVEEVRQTLMQKARQEVQEKESQWQAALEGQKASFLRELRERALQQLQKTMRLILVDLADVTLEERLIEVFLQRLGNLEGELLCQVVKSADHDGVIVVYSAFEIPLSSRQAITQSLQEKLSEPVQPRFETISELICGIELRATGCKLAWSLENYLETLEENLAKAFEEEITS